MALTNTSVDGIFLLTRSSLSIDFSHGDLFEGRPLFDLKEEEEECLKDTSLWTRQTLHDMDAAYVHLVGILLLLFFYIF